MKQCETDSRGDRRRDENERRELHMARRRCVNPAGILMFGVFFAGCGDAPDVSHPATGASDETPAAVVEHVSDGGVPQSRAEAEAYLEAIGVTRILGPRGFRKGTHIYASGTGIRDTDRHVFRHFEDLTDLSLGHNALTGSGLKDLQCPSLEALLLFETQVDDNGFQNLPVLPKLKRLFMARSMITGRSLEHVAKMTRLDTLDLDGTGVSDESLQHLTSLTELHSINLRRTAITDAGVRWLAACPALDVVNLRETQITDEGVAVVAQLPKLMNLNLTGTAMTDAAIEKLADSAAGSLNVLRLRGTAIGPDCIPALARLENLTTLDVRDTRLTLNS